MEAMDDRSPAEDAPPLSDVLPLLYRAVLDAVVLLEHVGDRPFALSIRRKALEVYSTRWDDHGRRSLDKLAREAEQRLAMNPRAAALAALSSPGDPA